MKPTVIRRIDEVVGVILEKSMDEELLLLLVEGFSL